MSTNIAQKLKETAQAAVKELFGADLPLQQFNLQDTRKEFEGDVTLVVFPFVRHAKRKPEQTGEAIGNYLKEHMDEVVDFNVIKGFLNLTISDAYWLSAMKHIMDNEQFGQFDSTGKVVVLEYIGPNTNKPLHLGHLRNIFLGYATANILAAAGDEVHKVNIYNDRGIAICKSMIAWQLFGEGKTPAEVGMKGDHFVGSYYVKFASVLDEQTQALMAEKGLKKDDAQAQTPIFLAAQDMLRKWEAGDEEVKSLWARMNGWVYDGFKATYAALGVDYEKAYKESDTYLLGKEMVLDGLSKELFYQKEDGSVWVDLESRKLDNKILLRKDGTSVYITQDLGVAQLRYNDYKMDQSIYVVADEQNYHFKVLKETLDVMGKPFAQGIHHLSYGMVDLTTGKMKSREGTVVDADDLVGDMVATAQKHTEELGKTEGFGAQESKELYNLLGLGALKYFILKVNPKKRMLFNPEESIDFLGHTGPFVQYTHARVKSIMRKFEQEYCEDYPTEIQRKGELDPAERDVLKLIHKYPVIIKQAADDYDPSVVANYAYQLAKTYNGFYNKLPILSKVEVDVVEFRVLLSKLTARTIANAMKLLGIGVPERM